MKVAFLFSGQGSQVVGMGTDLAQSCSDCRAMFQAADQALGFSLFKLMAEGPAEELRRTAMAQPAILALSVAQACHLKSLGILPDMLAGHSLGQYAALVLAGALDFASAIQLVAERGRLMQQTVPEAEGAMVAVVGLDRQVIYAACEAARPRGVVNVACHNAPGQTVISGAPVAVVAAAESCEEQGGGIVPLEVSVPFHCDLLRPMVLTFAELIAATAVADPALPVVDNVTARPLSDAASVRRSLVAQVAAPVLFEESLCSLAEAGVQHFIQCGPGKSLLGFARRAVPGAGLETFEGAVSRVAASRLRHKEAGHVSTSF